MYLFYTPDIATNHCLNEEESGHCVRVLRYKQGDEIMTMDGKGTIYTAVITDPHPKHCQFDIISQKKQDKGHSFKLHVAIAPTKNIERIEWMVEKCTEIGIDEITPLLCHFSERKQLRIDRLQKIVLAAAKQSLTPYLPKLNELTSFSEVVQKATEDNKCIAHCYKEDKQLLKNALCKGKDMLILIGPEGDFSEQEVQEALQNGFIPVSLGSSRLRTETAGVVACHTAILLNES